VGVRHVLLNRRFAAFIRNAWEEMTAPELAGTPIGELVDGLDEIGAWAIPYGRLPGRAWERTLGAGGWRVHRYGLQRSWSDDSVQEGNSSDGLRSRLQRGPTGSLHPACDQGSYPWQVGGQDPTGWSPLCRCWTKVGKPLI
jgi:hypothetical protein